MRILVCGINYAPDLIGVSKYNTELCEALAARGHQIRIVTAPPYYPEWKIPRPYRSLRYRQELRDGVEIMRAPIYVPANPSGARRLMHHGSFALSSAWPLLASAITWRPDVVLAVAPSLLSAPMALSAARLTGAAAWLHVQDFEIDAAFELGLLRGESARRLLLKMERVLLSGFDRVSTISPRMLRRLELKGVASDKIREVRNWVDTETISPGPKQTAFRTALGLGPNDIVALYSGAMSNKQGLDLLVEAAVMARSSDPRIHLVLCGSGSHKSDLQRLADAAVNVHFLDLQPLERLSELLRTADVHVLPQKAQAADLVLPSKLSGMLASGRPVIVMAETGTGLASEAIDAGLLVPPGDAASLAAALVKLANDAETREKLGVAARRRATQFWDQETIISSIERELVMLRPRLTGAPERAVPAG